MFRLYSGYSGKNLAYYFISILQDWNITLRLRYIITNNKPANSTAVNYIFKALKLEIYQLIKTKKAKRAKL